MIKIDLITGFLGSGKTTFLKKYIPYLLNNNENIALLEFDFGAINVDALILQEFNEKISIETVTGSNDLDCFKRRLKSKLISFKMRNFDRVIIEPSGVFDPSVLIDIVDDEPINDWYKINCSLCLVEPNNDEIILNQLATSKLVLISKIDLYDKAHIDNKIKELNELKEKYKLNFKIIDSLNFDELQNVGYNDDYIQSLNIGSYNSIYLLNKNLNFESINKFADKLFNLFENVSRIKGFIKEDKWYCINYTRNERVKEEVEYGQDVVIVVGKGINETSIKELL